MNRASLSWCLGAGAILALLTSLPFLLAFEQQGADLRFTGSLLAVEDGNSYIAKMRLGAEGDWLFRSPYTAMVQSGIPVFLAYILLGKLAQGPGMHTQLVALLHMARVAGTLLVVVATYRLATRFIDDERWRRWATVLAVSGGGLGWLILALGRSDWQGSQPLELYSPETFGFLAMLTFPHLLLARAVLLLGLDAYVVANRASRPAWGTSVWLALLVLLQPLSLAAAGAAIGMHQFLLILRAAWRRTRPFLEWRRLWTAATAFALPAVLLAGYGLLAMTDDFVGAWAAQNVLTSPHPLHYLLAFGLLLPAVGFAVARAPGDRRAEELLLVGWVLVLPMLAYAPTVVQRRLPEGGWVALAILAALGFSRLRLGESVRWRMALATSAMSLVGSVLLLAGAFQSAASVRPPVFRPAEEVAAFEWLDANAPKGAVVLASFDTGNALPAWADVRVVVGHGPESAGLRELQPRVEAFFRDSGASAEAASLLVEQGVTYVFAGPAERALGFSELRKASSLHPAYSHGEYAIYAVAPVVPEACEPCGESSVRPTPLVGVGWLP